MTTWQTDSAAHKLKPRLFHKSILWTSTLVWTVPDKIAMFQSKWYWPKFDILEVSNSNILQSSTTLFCANIFETFFQEFTSKSKPFYLIKYWYFLQFQWLSRIFSIFDFSFSSMITGFRDRSEHFIDIESSGIIMSMTTWNTRCVMITKS